MTGYIYIITNIYNSKVYIGQTIDYSRRIKEHLYYKKRSHNPYIENAIIKYGINNFTHKVLFKFSCENSNIFRKILDSMEKYYIAKYKSNSPNRGYNLTSGGGGMSGYKITEAHRENLRKSHIGWVPTEETRKRMSKAQKGLKKPMSDKGRSNISKSHLGKPSLRKRKICQYDKNTLKLIKVWDSISEAVKYFNGKSDAPLIMAIKGQRRHKYYKEFLWKYYEDRIS